MAARTLDIPVVSSTWRTIDLTDRARHAPRNVEALRTWIGARVVDRAGCEVGLVDGFYCDEATGITTWLAVRTGTADTTVRLVPIQFATPRALAHVVRIVWDADAVRTAPPVPLDGGVAAADERVVYDHYGLSADALTPVGDGAGATRVPTPSAADLIRA
jgi:hypothetical protein